MGAGPIAVRALYYGANGVQVSNYEIHLPAAMALAATKAANVSFRGPGNDDFEFALPATPGLDGALQNCIADLERAWKFNAQPAVFRRPLGGRIDNLLAPSVLASERQRRSLTSPLQYQLLVDEQGRVARCDVVRSSGAPLVDVTGCNVLTARARFKPALDAAGQPTKAAFLSKPVDLQHGSSYFDSSSTWAVNEGRDVLNQDSLKAFQQVPGGQPSVPPPAPPPPPPPTSK
jgi:protein TonB